MNAFYNSFIIFLCEIIVYTFQCNKMIELTKRYAEYQRLPILQNINITRQRFWEEFLNRNITMTYDDAKYLIQNKYNQLCSFSGRINPYPEPFDYEQYIPIHSHGTLKTEQDFFKYIEFASLKDIHGQNVEKPFNETYILIYALTVYKNPVQIRRMILAMSHKGQHPSISKHFDHSTIKNSTIQNSFQQNATILNSTIHKSITQTMNPTKRDKINNTKKVAFILYVDIKMNIQSVIEELQDLNDIYFVEPRFNVFWGHITQAVSQLVLLSSAAIYFPNSLYVSFHSESDYPLQSTEYILEFLELFYPINYVGVRNLEPYTVRRLRKMHCRYPHCEQHIKCLQKLFPKRYEKPGLNYGKGSNWPTITIESARTIRNFVLNDHYLLNYLDYAAHPDENIFQVTFRTLNLSISKHGNIRYIVFEGAHPFTIDEKRLEDALKYECKLWARKFLPDKSDEAIRILHERIKTINITERLLKCA
ncbi:hypothetical protein TRFO_24241 [Tritrichomonas foetus]|uniref:Protein xylosyltransferase n=1 Tax=Tritrichomonas foetus TaxID=1144522 RepID=A0A1J4KCS2_9EUKA|nr:hypothetical protein TRFO_24241 [Tritrichomonas foetus]|eukprot:OHT07500.1 hypothetical protein TRFO_24241 [Tritrichomonas foetus]